MRSAGSRRKDNLASIKIFHTHLRIDKTKKIKRIQDRNKKREKKREGKER